MSQLIVYSASAGSGKTHRLAVEYIKRLMENPENYKHILAVTFTNKATNEMKMRILSELFKISKGEKTSIFQSIAQEMLLDDKTIIEKASKSLALILHNYSLFSISTIDSFVQKVIQSLLWEIGEQGNLGIELDTMPILETAADNLLDAAAQEDELLERISQMAYSRIDDGKSWDVRGELIQLGRQLFSEQFRLMSKEEIERLTQKGSIDVFREALKDLSSAIINTIVEIANTCLDQTQSMGLGPKIFALGERGVMGFFLKCQVIEQGATQLPKIDGKTVQNALNSPTGEEWVNKSTREDPTLFAPIQILVVELLHPSLEEIASQYTWFYSAQLVLKNLDNLALITDLWEKVKEMSKEEGFMLLSESGHLLRKLVKDNDAPFIYEKVGTRYNTYMIDEFQDTSQVQWHNFKPLIENSLSQDYFSMIVGDVKQAIYRWRNGNWSILAHEVDQDFPAHGVDRIALGDNWRSLPEIVHFNNTFFDRAKDLIAAHLEDTYQSKLPKVAELLSEQVKTAYREIEQFPQKSNTNEEGYVEINLLETDRDQRDTLLAKELVAQILQLKKEYPLNQIGILVRKRAEGQIIANMLIEHNRLANEDQRIPFVSQDGLMLKSSNVVRFIVSALRLSFDFKNKIEQKVFAKELAIIRISDEKPWHSIFSSQQIEEEALWLNSLNTRPLQEIFEAIVHRYELHNIVGELAYLAEFHEHMLSLTSKMGINLSRFLMWWNDKGQNLSLSLPDTTTALTITTIHKSKGLEYPVVFVPYASWPFREASQSPTIWVESTVEPFNWLPKYPIKAVKDTELSLFAQSAADETMKEMVDNLNLLYVAFTRAKRQLYIYVPQVTKSKSNSLKSTADIINQVIPAMGLMPFEHNEDGFERFRLGTKNKAGDESKPKQVQWPMDSYPVGNKHHSVNVQLETNQLLSETKSINLVPLKYGKAMHEIFSNIITINDVDNALNKAKVEGLIEEKQMEEMRTSISNQLQQAPFSNWFSGQWKVMNEQSILTPEGNTYIPDRVMTSEDQSIVIDFKFGEEKPFHKKQIANYKNLLAKMGYKKINAFLWYVDANNLMEV